MPNNNTRIKQLLQSASNHFKAGEYRLAEHVCQKILAINPKSFHTHYLLGEIAHQQGHLDKAAELISLGLEGNPANPFWAFNLGNIHYKRGNLLASEESLRRAISIKPDFWGALNNLGVVFREQGHMDESILA